MKRLQEAMICVLLATSVLYLAGIDGRSCLLGGALAATLNFICWLIWLHRPFRQWQFIFAWYDCWVGWYWDRSQRLLYILPLPMIGWRIRIYGTHCYVVTKEGYFYRPKAEGYTSDLAYAGRFTRQQAQDQITGVSGARMHHLMRYEK